MLIVGAGGLAAQMIDDLETLFPDNLKFWSESGGLYNFFPHKTDLIQTDQKVKEWFSITDNSFIIAVGNPQKIKMLTHKFETLGGIKTTFFSPSALISKYAKIGLGSIVLAKTQIEAGVIVQESTLINVSSTITHGTTIGSFCEIATGVIINGNVTIGDSCSIGSGAIILPKVKIGNNCIVGAGSVVTKDVPDGLKIKGVPAK